MPGKRSCVYRRVECLVTRQSRFTFTPERIVLLLMTCRVVDDPVLMVRSLAGLKLYILKQLKMNQTVVHLNKTVLLKRSSNLKLHHVCVSAYSKLCTQLIFTKQSISVSQKISVFIWLIKITRYYNTDVQSTAPISPLIQSSSEHALKQSTWL